MKKNLTNWVLLFLLVLGCEQERVNPSNQNNDMADVKISELLDADALTGEELVPVVQGAETKKTTTQGIADLGGGYNLTPNTEVLMPYTYNSKPVYRMLFTGSKNFGDTLAPAGFTNIVRPISFTGYWLESGSPREFDGWIFDSGFTGVIDKMYKFNTNGVQISFDNDVLLANVFAILEYQKTTD